jgi:hypothetical protein
MDEGDLKWKDQMGEKGGREGFGGGDLGMIAKSKAHFKLPVLRLGYI